jgi:hypothetical protein
VVSEGGPLPRGAYFCWPKVVLTAEFTRYFPSRSADNFSLDGIKQAARGLPGAYGGLIHISTQEQRTPFVGYDGLYMCTFEHEARNRTLFIHCR